MLWSSLFMLFHKVDWRFDIVPFCNYSLEIRNHDNFSLRIANNASTNPTFYGELINPQSLNKYTYTYNNPLRYNDPNGHEIPSKGSDGFNILAKHIVWVVKKVAEIQEG